MSLGARGSPGSRDAMALKSLKCTMKNNRVYVHPPLSKSEALRLGVHLILLYFIRISLLSTKIFFYLGVDVDVGVGGRLFCL